MMDDEQIIAREERRGMVIWFAEDIRNALLAANQASAATAAVIAEVGGKIPPPQQAQDLGQAVPDSTELLAVSLRAYREGYKAALVTVALAFGIAPQAIVLKHPDRTEELLGTVREPADAPGVPAHEGAALPPSARWGR